MRVIGVTGGVGAGKSTVLQYMENTWHARLILADQVGHEVMEPGKEAYGEILKVFGRGILQKDGSVDRGILGGIVFADKEKLEKLNAIVHPAVKDEIRKKIAHEERKHTNVFIVESALLIEDSYDEFCDELWYIYVEDETRKKRLIFSRGYDAKKVADIISSQSSKDIYLKHCDRVIDNNGVFAETTEQLDCAIKDL